nr:NADH dehydrogenase subunit 2 [Euwallacea interjectus]
MFKFFKLLFSMTLVMGTIISISSMSWFYSWLGLEINLLSFIILMKTPNSKYSSESISKYFMVQAMASFILLFSIMLSTNFKMNFDLSTSSSILASLSLLMKMGAAPLHFWFPEVASGMTWNLNFILLTWQKIAPMILLSYLIMIPNMMIIFIVASSILGSILGLNQVCLRKILAYSSINHISWMLAAIMCSMNTWLTYLMIYSMMNFIIIQMFKLWKILYISQLSSIKNNLNKLIFVMNFLSLGGLPPFPGFMPKWIVINQLSNNLFFYMTITMIIFTLVTLFFYMRITFSSLTLYVNNSIIFYQKSKIMPSVMTLMIFPLMIVMTMSIM